MRRLPMRMPVGPKRAPGRYVTAVSNGIPRTAMSNTGDIVLETAVIREVREGEGTREDEVTLGAILLAPRLGLR
jgi:hypothetical protein